MANVLRNPLRSPIRGPLRSAIRNAIQGRLFYSWSGTSLESGYGNASMPVVGDTDYDRNTFDHLGIVRYLKAEEMPVVGMRRVENLLSASEDFSDASWATQNTASVTGANTLNFPAVNDRVRQASADVRVREEGISTCARVELSGSGTITIGVEFTAGGGYEQANVQITLTAEPKVYAVSHTNVNGGHANAYFRIYRNTGDTATQVTANFAQLENTTGSPDPTIPSEYCSSDTDYGWNTTGVRYFTYLNPLSVSSGIVTDTGTRTPIDPSIIKGYGPQGSCTEISEYSADFSGWTVASAATVAQDAVGLTGADNEAWTITDSDNAALQFRQINKTIANDSSTYYMAIRVAYDPAPAVYPHIIFLLTGGASQSEDVVIDPSDGTVVETSSDGSHLGSVRIGDFWYVFLSVANNSTGNTVAALRVSPAYNTDGSAAQDVTAQGSTVFASCELYRDAYSFRPILTTGGTTQTMLADTELTLPALDFTEIDPEGSCTFELTPYFEANTSSNQVIITPNDGVTSRFLRFPATGNARITLADGTNTTTLADLFSAGQTISVDLTWSTANSEMSIAVDGGTPVTAAYDGSFSPSGLVTIFKSLARMAAIKNVRFYKG